MSCVLRSVRRQCCSSSSCCGLRRVRLRRHRRDSAVAHYCVLRQRLVSRDASSFAQRKPVFLEVARDVLARHAVHVHQLRATRAEAASACTRLNCRVARELSNGGRTAADAASRGGASQAWLCSRVRRGKRARRCRERGEYPDPNHQRLLIGAVSEQPSALQARMRARRPRARLQDRLRHRGVDAKVLHCGQKAAMQLNRPVESASRATLRHRLAVLVRGSPPRCARSGQQRGERGGGLMLPRGRR